MTTKKFGLSVALATALQPDSSIDYDKCVAHAFSSLSKGCDSVTLLGTTGEAASVSPAERRQLLSCFATAGISKQQLITGVFATDVTSAAERIREALEYNCKRFLIAPPYYFKPVCDKGVFNWFSSVINELDGELVDLILYNLPSQTGVSISPALVSRLREHFADHIVGVKDSSGDAASTHAYLESHQDLSILVGDERQLAGAVAKGADGAICGIANVLPKRMRRIIDSASEDSIVNSLVNEICKHPIIPAIKYIKSRIDEDQDWTTVRAPFATLSSTQVASLDKWFTVNSEAFADE